MQASPAALVAWPAPVGPPRSAALGHPLPAAATQRARRHRTTPAAVAGFAAPLHLLEPSCSRSSESPSPSLASHGGADGERRVQASQVAGAGATGTRMQDPSARSQFTPNTTINPQAMMTIRLGRWSTPRNRPGRFHCPEPASSACSLGDAAVPRPHFPLSSSSFAVSTKRRSGVERCARLGK